MQHYILLLQQSGNFWDLLNSDWSKGLVGILIGSIPYFYTIWKDKTRWPSEQEVLKSQGNLNTSEVVENIVGAAGMLLEQSQKLNEKNAALITTYEATIERQDAVIREEVGLRRAHEEDIKQLKIQVSSITSMMVECSREIVLLIKDLQEGNKIHPERLQALESKWNNKSN